MATLYEAYFRYYPTEREIELMCREFSVQRLEEVRRDCMDPHDVSKSFRMQADEVDYRAFCHAIGATKITDHEDVPKVPTDDPAYKEYTENPEYAAGEAAFRRLLEAH